MKREIKFRVWDSETDSMKYANDSHDSFSPMMGKLKYYNLQSGWVSDILMQFIGLKDKNGVDIYEGDIIKTDDPNYGYGGKHDTLNDGYIYSEIIFDGGCFCLHNGTELYNYTQCEVIGNIHENKDLLK